MGRVAMHVRRRLRDEEAMQVEPVRDLRGTVEGMARYQALRDQLPAAVIPLARQELGAA
jgi:hypothetical protein